MWSAANKKFELMLTRCAKAYSSSCSQIALGLVYGQLFHRNPLLKCAVQPKIAKKTMKPIIFRVRCLSKSSMLIRLKSSSLMLVVIGSMPIPICNCFHRLASNGKITSFRGYQSLMPSCTGFLEPRRSRLGPLKSTLNAENFICSLSWSICRELDAIHSWNVSHSPKLPKNP